MYSIPFILIRVYVSWMRNLCTCSKRHGRWNKTEPMGDSVTYNLERTLVDLQTINPPPMIMTGTQFACIGAGCMGSQDNLDSFVICEYPASDYFHFSFFLTSSGFASSKGYDKTQTTHNTVPQCERRRLWQRIKCTMTDYWTSVPDAFTFDAYVAISAPKVNDIPS
ncbi:uncharacterized protein LOC129586440 [Paramacrobiotus metropolitanus]|uniref:uncharacterized protein LOC129586440 n=1 Tax=Paramacrobiotus metropolitanus TaxID=2943436 RepID=UPI002445CEF9|nr:uncharacterized protein LOC129586440 [Paramacrobiotus metropolitanus]